MVTAVADHIKEYRDEALASTGTAPPLGAPSPCPGGPVDAVTPDRHPSRARDPTGRPSSVRARPGTAAGTARGRTQAWWCAASAQTLRTSNGDDHSARRRQPIAQRG